MLDTLVMVRLLVAISMNVLWDIIIAPQLEEYARILLVTIFATDVSTVILGTVYFAMTLMNASLVVKVTSIVLSVCVHVLIQLEHLNAVLVLESKTLTVNVPTLMNV